MRVEKIARKHRSIAGRCHNRCMAKVDERTGTGYRVATHRVWLIGYPTPLCTNCAAVWERVYDENVGPVQRKAAA